MRGYGWMGGSVHGQRWIGGYMRRNMNVWMDDYMHEGIYNVLQLAIRYINMYANKFILEFSDRRDTVAHFAVFCFFSGNSEYTRPILY